MGTLGRERPEMHRTIFPASGNWSAPMTNQPDKLPIEKPGKHRLAALRAQRQVRAPPLDSRAFGCVGWPDGLGRRERRDLRNICHGSAFLPHSRSHDQSNRLRNDIARVPVPLAADAHRAECPLAVVNPQPHL